MRRFALLMLGVLAATWLQFEFFPGHTYLKGESQQYLPVLERLDAPGYLSRDLVATHTRVSYTIYDEVTLFLHEALHLKFQTALEGQQIVCRAAALTGVLLLALSAGTSDLLAFLIAMFVTFGAVLCGPSLWVIDPEPVPRAFAFALVLFASGLLVQERPLLAGLAGGIALVYDPFISAPFWLVAAAAFAVDRGMRHLLRPALTILAIFVLLLANLAQLQPGAVEPQAAFGVLPAGIMAVEQYRTPNVWISLWSASDIWSLLAIYVCGVWATTRIWRTLNRTFRWFVVALPLGGVLSMPVSYLALERMGWPLASQVQPTRTLIFTVAFCSLACAIAGSHAAVTRKRWEAMLWFVVVFALPINARILDLVRLNVRRDVLEAALCAGLALVLALGMLVVNSSRARYATLLVPALAALLIPKLTDSQLLRRGSEQPLLQLADWAKTSTWGSSMFLFPDAGQALYPGLFRAASRRAVWVDWTSGALVDRSTLVAVEWWDRWQQTMQGMFTPQHLQEMLSLPIDYYVLRRQNQLQSVPPIFHNGEFVVYDAADLRRTVAPLRLATHRAPN